MANAKKTSFTATKVAENCLALGVAFMRIQELEKEVSRLRHHVSVLSKRLKGGKEKGKEREKEEVAVRGDDKAEVVDVGTSPITSGA